MNITADTNLLVRVLVQDDVVQASVAESMLNNADRVAIAVASFCELVWVLRRLYRKPNADIAMAVRAFIVAENVITDRLAVNAGLAVLDQGGDFSDGVIAYEGAVLGAEEFVSFDKTAVAHLARSGVRARLLA